MLGGRTGGVYAPPPKEAVPHRTRLCLLPYPLQVETVNPQQAPKPPDGADILPVQADGSGGLAAPRSWSKECSGGVCGAHPPPAGLPVVSHQLTGHMVSPSPGRLRAAMRRSVRVTPRDCCSRPGRNWAQPRSAVAPTPCFSVSRLCDGTLTPGQSLLLPSHGGCWWAGSLSPPWVFVLCG